MKAIISRTYNASETIGSMFVMNGEEKLFACKTIELPDLGNQPNCSCIPEGTYDVVKWVSPSKGRCFKLLQVPARSNILIHSGNYAAGLHPDTLGCILPGKYFSDINEDRFVDVVESWATMKRLLNVLPDKFKLYIL